MKTSSLWHSFRCGFVGLWDVFRSGRNAKIHAAVAGAVIVTGLCLPLSRTDWAILGLTIGAVIAAEAANTAIEILVDLVSPEYHELARRSKDTAAGAVLVLAITAIVIGGLILGPPLGDLVRHIGSD